MYPMHLVEAQEISTRPLVAVPATVGAQARFEAALQDVPADVSTMSDDELRELVQELPLWDVDACERVLACLAAHGSVVAFELIAELRMELPPDAKDFAELAFATSLSWLGFDYERAEDDTAPRVTPRDLHVVEEALAA